MSGGVAQLLTTLALDTRFGRSLWTRCLAIEVTEKLLAHHLNDA